MLSRRRQFLSGLVKVVGAFALSPVASARAPQPEIAITMDDPEPDTLAGISGTEINHRILSTLREAHLTAALFVCGKRVDNPEGQLLLKEWNAAGHILCNHSYSHQNYNSTAVSYDFFADDMLKNEPIISGYSHFTRLFRYPFLKEGDTSEKRDRFRNLLHEHGYRVGHVTVDASDWYIDQRMRARLEKNPNADTSPYRDYYVAHIRDRAGYYRQLARDVLGRDIRHTLLIHHNLLNAMFLSDILTSLRHDGWHLIDAADAFRDPVFKREPKTIPSGESLVWALAKETEGFEDRLRYPGEDDVYEKPKMDAFGL